MASALLVNFTEYINGLISGTHEYCETITELSITTYCKNQEEREVRDKILLNLPIYLRNVLYPRYVKTHRQWQEIETKVSKFNSVN